MDQPNVLRTTKIGGGFVKEDVLAYVDELNSQIYTLQEERDELAKKIAAGTGGNEAKNEELQAEIDRLRGDLGTTKNQLRAAQEELHNRPVIQGDGQGVSAQELQEIQQKLVDAQADLEAKSAELELAQAETAEMNQKLVEMEARMETLEGDNQSLRSDLAEAAAQALTAGANPEQAAQIEAMRERTETAEAEIASLRAELDAKNAMIEESAGLSNEADLQKLAEYEAMLSEQSTAITEKDNEIEKLKQQIEDLKENGGDADSSFDMGSLFMEAQATAKKVTNEARREADKRISEAKAQAEKIVKDATDEADKLVSDAKAEAEQTVSSANAQADETVKNANAEAEKKLNDADAQAIKTIADAEESVRQSLADAERRTKTTTETARTVRALLRSEIDSVSKKFGEIALVLENLSGQANARITEAKNVIGEARNTVSDDDSVPAFDSFDDVANKSFSKGKDGKFDFDELTEIAGGTEGWN